jgi:hypothetical protein
LIVQQKRSKISVLGRFFLWRTTMNKFRIFVAVAALGLSATVPAVSHAAPVIDMSDVIGSAAMGSAIEYAARQGSSDNGQSGSQKQNQKYRPQSQSIAPANLTYKVSMQRRKANFESFIQKSMAANPVAGAEVRNALSGKDIIAMASPVLGNRFGLQINRVNDAYAFWMVMAWGASNNVDGEPTRQQFDAVKSQVSNTMNTLPNMQNATDIVKQNFAEALWVQGIFLNEAMGQIQNDPAAQRKLAASVMASSKREMNVDFSTITLTDSGFVPRKGGKRGDAGEAVDGALPGDAGAGQLASASAAPTPSSGMGGGDIALLVAAVSAGAGGIFMIGKGIAQSRG